MTIPSLSGQQLLFGRERELSVLRQHLDAVFSGQGSLVLIGGEAGIGKSTLADVLCREAAEQGALVLVSRCYDLTETPPYGLWLELFGQYRHEDGMPPPPVAFAEHGRVAEAVSQAALFDEVVRFVGVLATQRPLVLLFDDLHWCDQASLDLLRFFARTTAALPVFAVAAYRADELTRRHPLYTLLPLLVREANAARLDLRPFDDSAVRALVGTRYGLGVADMGRLAAYLHARADGNPLFVEELLRTLQETRDLRHEEGRWTLGGLADVRVPPLLHQVIEGRLVRLGDDAVHRLEWAAVIGQEVPVALWETVIGVGQDALTGTIERAVEVRILDAAPNGMTVRFVHALIREALYEGILPMRRRGQHRVAGEALAALPTPDPDAVAYHFQRAGDGRALEWLMQAGERAQQAWAWLAAADRFETALALMGADTSAPGERGWLIFRLALLRRYGDTARALRHLEAAGRLAHEADDALLAAQVQFYQGNVRCLSGKPGQGVAEMAAGVAALTALPPFDATVRPGIALTDVTSARVAHYTWLGNIGRLAEARALGEGVATETVTRAPDGPDGIQYGTTVGGLAPIYAYLGDVEASRRAFVAACSANRALDSHLLVGVNTMYALIWRALAYHADDVTERRRLAQEAEEAWARGSGGRAAVPARFTHAPVLFIEGEWDAARALAFAGHEESGGYVLSKVFAFATLGPLAQAQGDAELAGLLLREWLPNGPASPPGSTFFMATILQRMAAGMAIERGDLPTARAWLEAEDDWLAWSGAVLGQAERHLGWARYHRVAGNTMVAREQAARSLAHANEPRQPLALIAAHRLLGELDTSAGQYDDTPRHLRESLRLADACQAPYERALTLLADAELRAATGEVATARILLDEVRAIFTTLGALPALARTDALATRLAPVRPVQPAQPAGLSAREVEVLRLVAAGRTNGEIAELLFLSKRTVQVHVAHILAKTRADNRAAAAAFAQRHGLA